MSCRLCYIAHRITLAATASVVAGVAWRHRVQRDTEYWGQQLQGAQRDTEAAKQDLERQTKRLLEASRADLERRLSPHITPTSRQENCAVLKRELELVQEQFDALEREGPAFAALSMETARLLALRKTDVLIAMTKHSCE